MKNLYTKLAVDGIKNNSKLYYPYMLSIACVTAIYYILTYLTTSESVGLLNGGGTLIIILIMGKIVLILFSLFFLFYTNSFLAKKRNKEFALYNILGMNKKNVVKILGREAFIEAVVSIFGGLLSGILFSKLFELLLFKLCGHEPDFMFYFSLRPVTETVLFFGIIIFILFLFSVFKVAINRPIELLRSTNAGEKEPKANYVLGIIGLIVLIAAYYISMSISSPVDGLLKFFGAVIMVIAATYALFVAGSVCLCKILKKNKNFYYNKKHFISVSGMAYRMKRNGAGLASICILSTMVLVMVASCGSLYIGKEDSMRKLCPQDIVVSLRLAEEDTFNEEKIDEFENLMDKELEGVKVKNVSTCRQFSCMGSMIGKDIKLFNEETRRLSDGINLGFVSIYSVEDYEKNAGPINLSGEEAMVSSTISKVPGTVNIYGKEYKANGIPNPEYLGGMVSAIDNVCVVTSDFEEIVQKALDDGVVAYVGGMSYISGFDTGLSDDENIALANRLQDDLNGIVNVKFQVRALDAQDFMEMYGGLFLLGIFLSIAFIMACVLIMYYKQITEGYEDANNYSIMRKVGMTKKEIKTGIKTQTLITFFSPLILAGVHLFFSFPLVEKLLNLFGIIDTKLLLCVYGLFFLVFAVFYFFVYKKTVKVYLEIVSY